MFDDSLIKKYTDFSSIVIVRRDVLLSQGNRAFIKYYDEYGYGFLYLGKDDCISDAAINIIIPNTTSINTMAYRCYINTFCRCDCKIINIDVINSFPNIPIIERINLFCNLSRKFTMFD